jgi:hemolysin activation/secretion protein
LLSHGKDVLAYDGFAMTHAQTSAKFLSALALMGINAIAQAQTIPDAGSLLQQIERDRQSAPKRLIRPDAPVAPEMKAQPGLAVTVTQFKLLGNTLLGEEPLQAALATFLNRPLGFADLQLAAAAVAERYRQAGWVVRAYLPKQEIEGSSVIIQIIEGRFGAALIDGEAPSHLPVARVLRYIQAIQQPGEAINADAIERAVMLLDDLPGISAASTFREGKEQGETDLVLKLVDTPAFVGNVESDNGGSRSTGAERASGNFYLESLASWGEQISLNLTKTQGSQYSRLALTAPMGYNGLRFGINTSHLAYNVVTPESAALDIRGTAQTTGLEASYPVLRARSANLNLLANLDHKAFDNWTNTGSTNSYTINVAMLSLNANAFDGLSGGGANSASLALLAGSVDLTDSANQAADAASTQTEGRYHKWKLSLSRNQSISDALSLYTQYSMQGADRNLDSSEKLTLGGPSGVRAYPGGEGSGAEGKTFSLEVRLRLPEGLNLSAFYDWAQITAVNRINTSPSGNTLSELNAMSLRGYGLSLSWVSSFGGQFKATWARRNGDNPSPTSTGNDQDGSLRENRFWLSASLPF